MKISDDDLKRLFRSHIKDKTPLLGENCPTPEVVAGLFFQRNEDEEKAKIIDHISNCARCLEVFELCLEMSRSQNWVSGEIEKSLSQAKKKQSAVFNLPRRLKVRPFWKRIFIPLSAAIFLTIAILMIRFISTNKSIEDRGRPPGSIYLISPGSEISFNAPIVFRWEIAKEKDFTLLDIFDDALLPIWKSPRIFGDSYELPPEARAKIKKGKTYFWMVTLFFLDGTDGESALEEFSLRE